MSFVKPSLLAATALFAAFLWLKIGKMGPPNVEQAKSDDRAVFFFDIDNCVGLFFCSGNTAQTDILSHTASSIRPVRSNLAYFPITFLAGSR
jgi:hypothetical protein